MKKINLPFNSKILKDLKAGDELLLSGVIYTARDQAHKRLVELLSKKKRLPIDLKTAVIYYCGPNPGFGRFPIGACGPTTSMRMDEASLRLLKSGLRVTIGKGRRCAEVRRLIKRVGGAYLLAPAGCGALLAKAVRKVKLTAFGDLKAEAMYEFNVVDFPVIVGIDSKGRDIFKRG